MLVNKYEANNFSLKLQQIQYLAQFHVVWFKEFAPFSCHSSIYSAL
jgi:hypothetical protein